MAKLATLAYFNDYSISTEIYNAQVSLDYESRLKVHTKNMQTFRLNNFEILVFLQGWFWAFMNLLILITVPEILHFLLLKYPGSSCSKHR